VHVTRRRLVVLALVVGAGVGIYASGVLDELPDVKTLIGDIAESLGRWTYLLVGVLAFLETGAFVGLVAPGETVVIAGGVIAGQGEISLVVLIAIVWACAFLGDTTSFFIGRRLGREFIVRHGPRVKITEPRLRQVEGFFDRHGGKTILIGRFVGLVRALAPFIAGSSGLSYRRFAPYSVIGTGLWSSIFSVLGYVFYASFDRVAHVAGQATFAFGLTLAVVVGAVYAFRRLRDEEQRRRAASWIEARPVLGTAWRRAVVPVWRMLAPRLRFLWRRLTPGELGLEMTTALAFAAVGLYVFVLYAVVLSGDPGPTPLDAELRDLARDLRMDVVVDIAKVVTELGSLPVVAALVVGVGVVLAGKRRPLALGALVIGAITIYATVHLTKAGIDRPRPTEPLVDTSGSAYPSGHAAYSTAWVMVAAIAAWNMPSIARNTSLVGFAFVLAAVVGLSRIYLGAHWWSDVAGGWGLGIGVYATYAAVGLVISHVRQNEPAT
jgi:membrane protein DedA with SNARE-associated domain